MDSTIIFWKPGEVSKVDMSLKSKKEKKNSNDVQNCDDSKVNVSKF